MLEKLLTFKFRDYDLFNNLFYVRETYGENGKIIKIPKLRTLKVSNLSHTEKIEIYGVDRFGKILNDPCRTKLGDTLRRYWIDEIPQLYNVFNGDMNLVGIRPKEKLQWETYPDNHLSKVLEQKPGLIGIDYLIMGRLSGLECEDKVKSTKIVRLHALVYYIYLERKKIQLKLILHMVQRLLVIFYLV